MSNTEIQTCTDNNAPAKASPRRWRRPAYDVNENADAFRIQVNLPGVSRDGVDISLKDGTLNIAGSREHGVPEGWRPLRRELPKGDYRLSLRLNVEVNESEISAKVEDGVLDLTLPKADEVKPRRIEVN